MVRYLGLFFLMFGVMMAVFLSTKMSKIDADKYIKAVISEKLVKAVRYQ